MTSLPFTLTTGGASVVLYAVATLLDHYHYGSAALISRLKRWLIKLERINCNSLIALTTRISITADRTIFGPTLFSKRSILAGITLMIIATLIPSFIQNRTHASSSNRNHFRACYWRLLYRFCL